MKSTFQRAWVNFILQVISNNEEFRINLDISHFSPNEITLKTKNNKVVVHAKHEEREDEYGIIEREFKRHYILPKASAHFNFIQ